MRYGPVVDLPVVGHWSVIGGCSVGSECATDDGSTNAVVAVVAGAAVRVVTSAPSLDVAPGGEVAEMVNVLEPSSSVEGRFAKVVVVGPVPPVVGGEFVVVVVPVVEGGAVVEGGPAVEGAVEPPVSTVKGDDLRIGFDVWALDNDICMPLLETVLVAPVLWPSNVSSVFGVVVETTVGREASADWLVFGPVLPDVNGVVVVAVDVAVDVVVIHFE